MCFVVGGKLLANVQSSFLAISCNICFNSNKMIVTVPFTWRTVGAKLRVVRKYSHFDLNCWHIWPGSIEQAKKFNSTHTKNRILQLHASKKNINLHRPGIEPGSPAWQASILPLNYRCTSSKSSTFPIHEFHWALRKSHSSILINLRLKTV